MKPPQRMLFLLTLAGGLAACSAPVNPEPVPPNAYLSIWYQTSGVCDSINLSSPSGSLGGSLSTVFKYPARFEEPTQGFVHIGENSSDVVLSVQCLKSGASRPAATLTYPYQRGEVKRLAIKDDATTPEGVTLRLSLLVRPD